MKKMNFKTKKMQQWFDAYCQAKQYHKYTLSSVYAKPSATKQREWERICKVSFDLGGTKPVVISYNTFFFTAAFVFTDEDLKRCFVVETQSEQYISEIKED